MWAALLNYNIKKKQNTCRNSNRLPLAARVITDDETHDVNTILINYVSKFFMLLANLNL